MLEISSKGSPEHEQTYTETKPVERLNAYSRFRRRRSHNLRSGIYRIQAHPADRLAQMGGL